MQTEIQNLTEPPALLIGTPGRIGDHIRRSTFVLDGITTLILDEFDKSLALGFEEEMSFIIGSLKTLTRRILVSATAGIAIPEFAGVRDLTVLDCTNASETTDNFTLKLVLSEEKDKVHRLFALLWYFNSEPALINCNHLDAVERTSSHLKEKGIEKDAFHGGMEQMEREQT